MKARRSLLFLISALALIITSCGENVDPAKGDVNIRMKAVTDLATVNPNARTAETAIEFTEVLLGVTEIELEGEGEVEIEDGEYESEYEWEYEIEFEGQFIVDLLNGTSDPDIGSADMLPGKYNELELTVSPILDDGGSVSIKFNITQDGNDPIPVELTTSKEFEIEFEHEGSIEIDLNSVNQILVLFDLDELLANLDLASLEVDEDGVLRINENSNKMALMTILQAFYGAFDAGEDNDDDDEFDDDDD